MRDDEGNDRQAALDLLDAVASREKMLVRNMGGHTYAPAFRDTVHRPIFACAGDRRRGAGTVARKVPVSRRGGGERRLRIPSARATSAIGLEVVAGGSGNESVTTFCVNTFDAPTVTSNV